MVKARVEDEKEELCAQDHLKCPRLSLTIFQLLKRFMKHCVCISTKAMHAKRSKCYLLWRRAAAAVVEGECSSQSEDRSLSPRDAWDGLYPPLWRIKTVSSVSRRKRSVSMQRQRPPISTAFKTNNLRLHLADFSLHCGDLLLEFGDLRHEATVIRLCELKESWMLKEEK